MSASGSAPAPAHAAPQPIEYNEERTDDFWNAMCYLAEKPIINTNFSPSVLVFDSKALTAWLSHGPPFKRPAEFKNLIIFPANNKLSAIEKPVEPTLVQGTPFVPPPVFTGLKGYAEIIAKYGEKCSLIVSEMTKREIYSPTVNHQGPVFMMASNNRDSIRNRFGFSDGGLNLVSYTRQDYEEEMAAESETEPSNFAFRGLTSGETYEWPKIWINVTQHTVRIIPTEEHFKRFMENGAKDPMNADGTAQNGHQEDGTFICQPSGFLCNVEQEGDTGEIQWENGLPIKKYAKFDTVTAIKEIMAIHGNKVGLVCSTMLAKKLPELCPEFQGHMIVGASGEENAYRDASNRMIGSRYGYLYTNVNAQPIPDRHESGASLEEHVANSIYNGEDERDDDGDSVMSSADEDESSSLQVEDTTAEE